MLTPANGEEESHLTACRFAVGEGDLITFLNIWRGWEESGRSRKWSYKNFINHRTMLRAADIRNQLQRHVRYSPVCQFIRCMHGVACDPLFVPCHISVTHAC